MFNDTLIAVFGATASALLLINTPYGARIIDAAQNRWRLRKAVREAFKDGYIDDGIIPITETEFVPLKTKAGHAVLNEHNEQMYAIRLWSNDSTTLDALFPGTIGIVAQDLVKKARQSSCKTESPCIFAHLSKHITHAMRAHNDNPKDPIENQIFRRFIESNSEQLNKSIHIRKPTLGETYIFQNIGRVLIAEKGVRQERMLLLELPEWQTDPKQFPQKRQIADSKYIQSWQSEHPNEALDHISDYDPSVQHMRYDTLLSAAQELERQDDILKTALIRQKTGIAPASDVAP